MCNAIMKWNPDVVVTEKGVSGFYKKFIIFHFRSCLAFFIKIKYFSNKKS